MSDPRAYLLYGLDLGRPFEDEDIPLPTWAEDEGWGAWEDELTKALGLTVHPWADQDKDPAGHRAWSESFDAARQALRDYPVEIVSYGGEETAYAIAVKASETEANDWCSARVRTTTVLGEWVVQLREFAKLLGIELPADVEFWWVLTTDYS